MEAKELSYFRVKTECTVELPSGALTKKKIEELVLATSYTEAETLVNGIIETLERTKFSNASYEIIKTKISDVLFNEVFVQEDTVPGYVCDFFRESEATGVGLYAVKVVFTEVVDDNSGKEKSYTETFYVPALSNADANARVNKHLKDTATDYVIRDAKFDKAEAIYWPLDVHNRKYKQFTLDN